MHYIVALGNPGAEYETTRHNVGWLVTTPFISQHRLPTVVHSSKYTGFISEGVIADIPVTVLFPETFMNKTGSAVRKLVPTTEAAQLIAVYDDVDLPLGEVRVSFGRGDGGHNGVASIIAALDTKDFIRVRVGIAPVSLFTGKTKRPVGDKLQRYVMGHFTKRELEKVGAIGKRVNDILDCILRDGYVVAMNRFN